MTEHYELIKLTEGKKKDTHIKLYVRYTDKLREHMKYDLAGHIILLLLIPILYVATDMRIPFLLTIAVIIGFGLGLRLGLFMGLKNTSEKVKGIHKGVPTIKDIRKEG